VGEGGECDEERNEKEGVRVKIGVKGKVVRVGKAGSWDGGGGEGGGIGGEGR